MENKIRKTFGPTGSVAGIIIFFGVISATLIFSHNDIQGIITGTIAALIGAFVGFTYSSVFIDVENKRIKYSNNIFGLIRSGQWMKIENGMKIGISHSKTINRSYSRGNRVLDLPSEKYIVFLTNEKNQFISPLYQSCSQDSSINEQNKLSEYLQLPMVSE